jgi:hypothetical protein
MVHDMRLVASAILLLPTLLFAQSAQPKFLYIYRDSLKSGVDSAFRAIENDAAQICADLKCPNPYLALESLSGVPHEAWWINAFADAADTVRVLRAYATNRPLSEALAEISKRKEPLVGKPIQGFAVHRPELSRGAVWPIARARFVVVTMTRIRSASEASVWQMADSTLYIFRPARTRAEAVALANQHSGRAFVIRPNWSMPMSEWVAADTTFWRLAPKAKR